jgi:hypothetical protein
MTKRIHAQVKGLIREILIDIDDQAAEVVVDIH